MQKDNDSEQPCVAGEHIAALGGESFDFFAALTNPSFKHYRQQTLLPLAFIKTILSMMPTLSDQGCTDTVSTHRRTFAFS